MPKTRRVSRQMQLDKIMLRPGVTLTPEELEPAKKLKQAIEEDDDQQQYLLLTVNDEGQQVPAPTSTAPNPSRAPNIASNNPLTLPPEGAQNPMLYLQPPLTWREWGKVYRKHRKRIQTSWGPQGYSNPLPSKQYMRKMATVSIQTRGRITQLARQELHNLWKEQEGKTQFLNQSRMQVLLRFFG
ncbi:hypothetical protein BT96DRAFT_995264 [Gymnopus androsaceus JB14]|uniref:Uncharacterized protein n=1 Tax=Gymnopus androsaceus JB14 TaxID=1447944 RepID=A0A6A4HHA4_9AGAR|nr:hypothetical protein BT96DRAFT_995264 [Gymnopus androsaceus JB14]